MPSPIQDLSSEPLHALYVGSLGGDGGAMVPAMTLALKANFGSVGRWRLEFAAMGRAPGRNSGWVLLTFLPRAGTLVNEWAADHAHSLTGGVPILALDLDQHSHQTDPGADANVFAEAFMDNIDWALVYERYQRAVHGASEPFGATQDEVSGAMLLDVRRAGVFENAESLIPGARWHDPAATGTWAQPAPSVARQSCARLSSLLLRVCGGRGVTQAVAEFADGRREVVHQAVEDDRARVHNERLLTRVEDECSEPRSGRVIEPNLEHKPWFPLVSNRRVDRDTIYRLDEFGHRYLQHLQPLGCVRRVGIPHFTHHPSGRAKARRGRP